MATAAARDERRRRGRTAVIVGPPTYPRRTHTMVHFGDVRQDPYHWLRDRRNPEVRRLLQRENAHMESVFDAYGGTQLCRILFNEMRTRWKENDASFPHRDRSYWYYTRAIPGAEYPLFCRRLITESTGRFVEEVAQLWADDMDAPLPSYEDEVVYLDLNLLVKELQLSYVELGDMEVSPSEQQVAVALDCSGGREVYTILILDITDVNYARWLHEHSELHRAWAAAMLQSKQSIYSSPASTLPPQRSPTTPTASRRKINVGCRKTIDTAIPQPPPPSSSSSSSSLFSSPSPPPFSAAKSSSLFADAHPSHPVPHHKVVRRIDAFDAAGEVLWMNPTALLYVGLDSKMRSSCIIYHDLTKPVDSKKADILCYEEMDEMFWVSSLCFSADDRFAMFTVASGSCTEVYVIPCDTGVKRCITGVPIVCPSVDSNDSNHDGETAVDVIVDGDDEDDNNDKDDGDTTTTASSSSSNNQSVKDSCAVWRFADRASLVDHDIDHHESLFGEDVGAWVVVVVAADPTAGPPGLKESCVSYLLDDEAAQHVDGRNGVLSTTMHWQPLVAHDPDVSVEAVECLKDYLLFSVRHAAFPTVRLVPVSMLWDRWRNRGTGRMQPLSLLDDMVDLCSVACRPSGTCSEVRVTLAQLQHEQNEEMGGNYFGVTVCAGDDAFENRTWRVVVTHLTIPTIILAFTLEEGDDTLCVKQLGKMAVGGVPYCANDYDATVVWVPSDYAFCGKSPLPTGGPVVTVRIPVYMCWKKTLLQHGRNPLYLSVYGGYGDCCEVDFESERLVLLDRGFVWAAAAVRGGGELGIAWRDAGRKLQRATTVNDFVSVSQYLQDTGWCAAGRLVTAGASAGGFVVVAAMNAAPSLPLGVIASVPFVDCLTTLLDPTLPLTISDWEEFGNPCNDADAYRILRAVSPMDNIPHPGVTLPHILMQAAWQDTRVGFWESLAFTARLRERQKSVSVTSTDVERVILHHCDFGAGHGGASGRYSRLKEVAREYAFALLVQKAADANAAKRLS